MILTASQNAPNFQYSRRSIAGNSGLTKYSARTEFRVIENQSELLFSSSFSNKSLAGGFTEARRSSEVIVRC